MSKETVARRYAVALFQLAKEQHNLEQVEEEIRAVKLVFTENKQLLTILSHPKLAEKKKKSLLQEGFASVSTPVMNTLLLLIERHRENIITDMADEFIQLANENRGVADAIAYSVRLLSDQEKKALSEVFAKKVGRNSLRIENIVDNTLIGGIKLRIGNRIYDGSVSGKLARLERKLIG